MNPADRVVSGPFPQAGDAPRVCLLCQGHGLRLGGRRGGGGARLPALEGWRALAHALKHVPPRTACGQISGRLWARGKKTELTVSSLLGGCLVVRCCVAWLLAWLCEASAMETQLGLAPAVSVEEAASLPKAGSRFRVAEIWALAFGCRCLSLLTKL